MTKFESILLKVLVLGIKAIVYAILSTRGHNAISELKSNANQAENAITDMLKASIDES